MNENPEGTPNPLNQAPQPVNTPAPGAQTGASSPVTPEPSPAPKAPVTTPTATPETNEPTTAEQLLTQQPTNPVASAGNTPVTEARKANVAPKPVAPSGPRRVVDPMMARNSRPAAPVAAPVTPTPNMTQQPANPAAPANAAQKDNFTDDADTIIQQLSQNTTEQPAQPVAAPKKKGKKGLIALAIIFVLLAIGCAVAAIIILNPFAPDDRVPVAIDKFISGQVPSNVEAKGTITINTENADNGLTAMTINLDAQFANSTGTNTAKAAVTADFADGTELDFDADEITAEDGTVYLRLTGVADALKSGSSGLQTTTLNTVETPVQDCTTAGDGTTNCVSSGEVVEISETTTTCEGDACDTVQQDSLAEFGYIEMIINAFGTVDGEWIRIPQSQTSSDEETVLSNPMQCLTDAISTLPSYGSQIKDAYSANPFIEYSTENLSIAPLKDKLYRISINDQKFTSFVNSLGSNAFANELLACVNGQATNDGVTLEQVKDIFNGYPTVYVEVSDQYYFTRVVFDSSFKDGQSVKADLQLSYPESVSVVEPEEYVDLDTLIKAMLKDLYNVSANTVVIEGETVQE